MHELTISHFDDFGGISIFRRFLHCIFKRAARKKRERNLSPTYLHISVNVCQHWSTSASILPHFGNIYVVYFGEIWNFAKIWEFEYRRWNILSWMSLDLVFITIYTWLHLFYSHYTSYFIRFLIHLIMFEFIKILILRPRKVPYLPRTVRPRSSRPGLNFRSFVLFGKNVR